ncbi:potassium-transporting ATPase subunit C [Mycolicibacterium hippocampi]|uniref:Potassium-transporting ATPase KdpC subunit n=1 Tax=Mycolicibacterium hippocampi TaxID=659824 RepID=A0A7I9ZUZ1_9MYCO|nr:potassium-transporting ATPase subunit C [Mycolicibacterium hippocampi]GFH04881.1 potassium-transporting ATPase KdpC subunit [Mycolicibacterium hippocampi]
MKFGSIVRQHWAALRTLLVFTAVLGFGYPLLVWLAGQLPGLSDKADGSLVVADGRAVGSSLIGQSYTDADGNPLLQYFQGRPSAAGGGYDPLVSGGSNLGPESIVDLPGKPSLLTLVCSRSAAVGELDGISGARPFCTGGGVGAVLSVTPTRVVSVNEPCETTPTPFLATYAGVRVECAEAGADHSDGQVVPIRGAAPAQPVVPADAVTAGASGLDPHISTGYADLQVERVAAARGLRPDQVRALVAAHTEGRTLGFLGEPGVNVLELNLALDGG